MGRDVLHWIRLLKAPCSLTLNAAHDEPSTASLENLFQCLTTLNVKNLFLISNLNLLFFSLKPLHLVLSPQSLKKGPQLLKKWAHCISDYLMSHYTGYPEPGVHKRFGGIGIPWQELTPWVNLLIVGLSFQLCNEFDKRHQQKNAPLLV